MRRYMLFIFVVVCFSICYAVLLGADDSRAVFKLKEALETQQKHGQVEKERKRLDFLVGEWKSVAVDQNTGEKSSGNSSVHWIMDGKWLQWKFVAQLKQGPLEVLTLINYHKGKKQYAFYSFNPRDDEPIPHYGNWLDENTLRIETDFQGVEVWVDFKIEENGDFYQEHSRIAPSGERIIILRTKYSRIK